MQPLDFLTHFVSSLSVRECFKGFQQFKTVALGFNFRRQGLSFTPSYDLIIAKLSSSFSVEIELS